MYKLLFWLCIAALGLALYVSPSFFVRRMYEGFDNGPINPEQIHKLQQWNELQQVVKEMSQAPVPVVSDGPQASPLTKAPTKTNANVLPGPAGTASTNGDLMAMLQNFNSSVQQPQFNTPELTDTPPKPKIRATCAISTPEEASTMRSTPQTAEDAADTEEGGALNQGKSFQSTKPHPPAPVVVERIITKEVPSQCPPQIKCPDMRHYIRKDSIPCWACKLK